MLQVAISYCMIIFKFYVYILLNKKIDENVEALNRYNVTIN